MQPSIAATVGTAQYHQLEISSLEALSCLDKSDPTLPTRFSQSGFLTFPGSSAPFWTLDRVPRNVPPPHIVSDDAVFKYGPPEWALPAFSCDLSNLPYYNAARTSGLENMELGYDEHPILLQSPPAFETSTRTGTTPASELQPPSSTKQFACNLCVYATKSRKDPPPYWAAVTFGTGSNALTVYSVYSEAFRRINWQTPLISLATRERQGRVVMVGDFNAHHPLWDREGRTSSEAEYLLRLAVAWDMELYTPWGEPTRRSKRNGDRDSTIDHAWANRTVHVQYNGPEDHAGSDHAPQSITVNGVTSRRVEAAEDTGYSWALMDVIKVKNMAALITIPERIESIDALETATTTLMSELKHIADESVPKRKQNMGSHAVWWDNEVSQATRAARRAERAWRAQRTPATLSHLQEALKEQERIIRKAQTRTWRNTLQTASQDQK
ncbi:Endonuclease/exonuclease/phosphatase, partial [Podospora australis]